MSTKETFTPGEWKYVGHNGTHIVDSMGRCIADAPRPSGMSDEEGIANAHLIAAAPDLYAALKKMSGYLNSMPDLYVPDDIKTEARAALLKAEKGGV